MRSRVRPVVAVLAVLAVLAGAGLAYVLLRDSPAPGSSAAGAENGGASPPATSPAAVVTTKSPFTGRPAPTGRPVIAVKIDNVRPARPQTGLERADLIYVEPVEGGLSRIMAIFSSGLPTKIGPVRSARESDLELLAQYGKPGLAYSGANKAVLAAIRKSSVVDLSQNRVPSAYSRTSAKSAPHNLLLDPRKLLGHGGKISAAKDIGFRFGKLPDGLGEPVKRKTVKYGAASTAFTWSAARKQWDVSLDGRAAVSTSGTRLAAATVVVQNTDISASDLHDVLGNATPYTHTVGSGTAVVLRDGVAVPARWSRPSPEAGTTFTTADGAPLPFAIGPVWIVFARTP
jgi:hypothetical protein